jgi:hypothetical protein
MISRSLVLGYHGCEWAVARQIVTGEKELREQEAKLPFDTVRAFFVEGEPLYENAGLRALDHVQIRVRDPARIIGYFLPRGV